MYFYRAQDVFVIRALKTGCATGYNIPTTELFHHFLLEKTIWSTNICVFIRTMGEK